MSVVALDDPRRVRSRKSIVDATAELLRTGGSTAATVDSIIAQANVSRATLYRQFATVDEVIAASFSCQLPRHVRSPREGAVRDRLVKVVIAQARTARRNPAIVAAMCWLAPMRALYTQAGSSEAEFYGHEVAALRHQLQRFWITPFDAVLDDAVVANELGDVDRSLIVPLMVAPALAVSSASIERWADAAVDAFLRAQRRPQAAAVNP